MSEPLQPAKPIAITGGTGFIGRYLVDLAVSRGHSVRALTRRQQPATAGVEWVAGDLEDTAALHRLVSGTSAVFHCAGLVKALRDSDFKAVNTDGSRNLAEAVSAIDGTPPHLVHLSSLAAREPHLSAYARTKRHGEGVMRDALGSVPWTILRPPGVYGPGDDEVFALIRAMSRGYLPAVTGSTGRFSMIHVADLAAAMLAVANQEHCFARTIEVRDASVAGYSMADVAAIAATILDRNVRTVPVPAAALHVSAAFQQLRARISGQPAILSHGKVRELRHPDWLIQVNELADEGLWQPVYTLQSGLLETIRWYAEKGFLPNFPR
jgi:nucleoside-diphosphate-sugar epimerase